MNLRTAATLVFSGIVFILLAMASGLISANVRKLADKHGWDNFLVRWTEKLRWERLRGLWWLWSIFGLSGGVALALWVTPLIGVRTVPPTATSPSEIHMGPRTVIRISEEMADYAQEQAGPSGQLFTLAVIISGPPENSSIATFINELFLTATHTRYVRLLSPPGENDVGPLKLPPQEASGIIIHGESPYVSGVASSLGECFIVSTNSTLPQELAGYYNTNFRKFADARVFFIETAADSAPPTARAK